MRIRTAYCVLGMTLFLAGTLVGCGSGKKGSDPFSQRAFIGTWVEDMSGAGSPGGAMTIREGATNTREIVFGSDGTFKLTVCDAAGNPVKPAQTVEGTWQMASGYIKLATKQQSLAEGSFPPTYITRIQLRGSDNPTDAITVKDDGGASARYVRKGS